MDAQRTDEGYLLLLSRSVLRQNVEKQVLALLPLYGYAFSLQRGPHPTQAYAWPTFPLGEGFGRAYHFNKVLRLSPFFFQESLL